MAFDESERDDLLDRLVEEFAARLRRGERPALKEYTDRYPELADEIRELFPAMAQVEQAKAICHDWDEADRAEWVNADAPPPAQIGEYRIAREIGRGGMGVVYEAEQVSLGRRVALKVLPATPGRDGTTLARFRREARASARLHHTNIVPVFDVGQDGDIRYYAMQFIQGQSLDLVIRELRKLRGRQRRVPGGPAEEPLGDQGTLGVSAEAGVVHSLLTGRFHGGPTTAHAGNSHSSDPAPSGPVSPPAADTSAVMPGGTQLSSVESRHRAFHRGVAQIGRQVASALAYAHARGILHRDIKPSNLLLDTEGVVWVSDFGLAKVDNDELTRTGDILGTLRYMAPERFRGQGDARADVYSLGLTLYELLTLRPAFDSPDRLALSEKIKKGEPTRPRLIDPRVPRDLETILLKAIEKDPGHRYATAEAMAEDLRRFLDDEPILARRASAPERSARWARRNPLIATLGGLLAAVLFAATVASVLVARRMAAQAMVNEEAARSEHAARLEAVAARERAEQHLYSARIGKAEGALRLFDAGTARSLLDLCRPGPGEPDRRGWEWYYLDQWCEPELRKIALPGGASARCLALSPDGRLLAVGCWDPNAVNAGKFPPVPVYLIGLPDGGVRRELTGHRQCVDTVAFRPDGKRLASLAAPGTVRIWDTGSGRLERTFELGPAAGITGPAMKWSPDGRRLATIRTDGVVSIWDPETGRERARLVQNARSLAWSPDGTRIALSRIDGAGLEVRRWDAGAERLLGTIFRREGEASALSWSSDGRRLAVAWKVSKMGSHRGRLAVCDGANGDGVFELELAVPPGWIVFSPDGTRLVTGGEEGIVRAFDAADGRERAALLTGATLSSGLEFSPDGRRLYAAGWWSGGVKVLNPARDPRGRGIPGWPSQISAVSFDREGLRIRGINWVAPSPLYCADPIDGTIWVDRELSVTNVRRYPRGDFAFSPDAGRLAAPTREDRTKVGVWDTVLCTRIATLSGQGGPVTAVAFGPDGRSLAIATIGVSGSRSALSIWDIASGRAIRTLATGVDPVLALAYSGDGRRVAAGGSTRPEDGGWVAVWDTGTGDALGRLDGVGLIMSVAFHPDGDRIAIADYGQSQVHLWDLATGAHITQPGPSVVSCVAFSPDGTRLASLGYDGDVHLADAKTGDEVVVLRGFGPPHGSGGHTPRLAFSPDGSQLAATATEDTLNVWDLGTASGVEIEPGDGDVVGWLHRTRALAERDDAAGAAAAFARADKIPRRDASPWIKHAVWLWRRGETAQARHALDRALELLADEPARWTDIGRLLARFGRMTEFETVLAKARSLGERQLAREPGDESAAAVVADLLPDADESSVWTLLDPVMMDSAEGATLTRLSDGSVLAGGRNPLDDTYTIEARTSLVRITALRLEALPHPTLVGTGPGRSNDGDFMMDGIRLITMSESAGAVPVSLTHARADFWQANEDIVAPSGVLVAGSAQAWGIWPRVGQSHWAVFQAARPFENAPGTSLRVELTFRTRFKHHTLGRFRLSVTDRPFPLSLARLHLQAIKADTERSGLTRLGAAYSLLGDWTSAAAVLSRAAARPDALALDNFLLAMARFHLGRLDEAQSDCDRALACVGRGHSNETTHDMAIEVLMTIRGLNFTEAEGLLLDHVFPTDPFGPR